MQTLGAVQRHFVTFAILAAWLICALPSRAQNPAPASGTAGRGSPASVPSATKNLPFDHHDLSGIWWAHTPRGFSLTAADPPPMTKWAQERFDQAKPGLRGPRAQPLGNDPMMICDPMGFPRIILWTNYPVEIIQIPGRTLMFFDWFYTYRTIWADGRTLPADPDPRWYGNSVGHWDGDTFIVESTAFDDRSWLDAAGHPHSENMRLVERYRRVDHDTVEFSMVLTDPQAYTAPWVSDKMALTLADAKTAMREDVCVPSVEEKYREVIREPAGRGTPAK